MPTGSTTLTVWNEALQFVGSQTILTSTTPLPGDAGYQAASYLGVLYVPTVELMLREIEPDFARTTVALTLSSAPTPIPPWAFEYLYPADMIRLRQVRPPSSGTGALTDVNDPQPVRAMVDFDTIASVVTKVILTNQANALAVYTSSTPSEALWDAAFLDALVRRLSNPLAMALAGRPDYAEKLLMSSTQMAQTAEAIDDSGFRH